MQIPPTVHTALATALLIVSLVRFELSRRAVWKNRLHLTLDLAVSVPKDVLLVVYMGLSWAGKNAVVREVILGIASIFPFLLVVRATRLFLGFCVDHQVSVSPNEHPATKPHQYTIFIDDLFSTIFPFLMLDQGYSHPSWYLHLSPTASCRTLCSLGGLSELGFPLMVAGWVYNGPFPDSVTATLRFALYNRVGSCASSDCGLRGCPALLAAISGGNFGRIEEYHALLTLAAAIIHSDHLDDLVILRCSSFWKSSR
jgi:hypothetical protein